MRLTEHFTTQEFACHDGTPAPIRVHDELERLCQTYLEPLRRRYGAVTIVSGYRPAAYNRSVGGAPGSFHVYRTSRPGVAADVVCRQGSPSAWHAFLATMNPGGLGRYPTHVHVDNRTGHARW